MEHTAHTTADVQAEVRDYRNPTLTPDERVADILARMSLEEKVAQMLCLWGSRAAALLGSDGRLDRAKARSNVPDGMGQIGRISDLNEGLSAATMVERTNEIQKFFVEETRLGIPVIFHEECLHGLAGREATSYPQPIGLASSFNPELIKKLYGAIAEEVRMRGSHQALTPVIDVARDPRWGRVEETFGEDPYLVAELGVSAVHGFQGEGTTPGKKNVLATLKHFAAHGEPESGTNCAPVNVSERTLRDVFLYPFKRVISEANPASVMASYNEIDGIPSHANTWLLRDVLRGEWGFDGFVASDYYGITELHRRDEASSHAVAASKQDAAAQAARAGVNIEMPDPDCYPHLVHLVRSGVLSEALVDELVEPLLRWKFILGLFEHPYVDTKAALLDQKLEQDRGLALQAAQESIVLLKNVNGVLPLRADRIGTLAVIGPNADRMILGGYSGKPKYYVSILEGIQKKADGKTKVIYSEGCKVTVGGSWNDDAVVFPHPDENRRLIAEAVEVARKADSIVLVLGDNEQTSREAWSRTHLGDRSSLELFGMQTDLARAIVQLKKPVILLLTNGRPISITGIQEHMNAIVECWYLGQEAGTAIADLLFGDVNPSGKLPISIPRSVGHIPCYYNHKPSAQRGYIDADISPLYPFGFGLSYTTFTLSHLRLSASVIPPDGSTDVSVDVTNTGNRAGTEVVQVYIRDVVSSVTRPVKELRGFRRVHLAPGETATVSITLKPDHLAFTDRDMRWTVEPGVFDIMVGTSSRNQDLQKTTLTVQGTLVNKRA